jgi:hypothetical protein
MHAPKHRLLHTRPATSLCDVPSPRSLTRDIQRLGDAAFDGDDSTKKVFWRLEELDTLAEEQFGGTIAQMRRGPAPSGGQGTRTRVILKELLKRLKRERQQDKVEGGGAAMETDASGTRLTVDPPKAKQVRRALSEGGFPQLEQKYLSMLQAKDQPGKDPLQLIGDAFKIENPMPKAVLLQVPGVRISTYTTESELLDLLKDEKIHLDHYYGQCLAWDEDDEEVPDNLLRYKLKPEPLKLFRELKWGEIDVLNDILLDMVGEDDGAEFDTWDVTMIYHYKDMIDNVAVVYNKLFLATGYPETVTKEEGVTFMGWVKKLKKLHKAGTGLTDEQALGLYQLVDELAYLGLAEAAAEFQVKVYGAAPGTKRLRAWLSARSLLLKRIDDALAQLKKKKDDRVHLPGIFSDTVKARTAPGFELKAVPRPATHEKVIKKERKVKAEKKPKKGADPSGAQGGGALVQQKDDGKSEFKASGKKLKAMSRQERLNVNPKCVYYYDDGSFSKGKVHFKWHDICAEVGIDPKEHCGPVLMSTNMVAPHHCDCMNPKHTDDGAEHKACAAVQYKGKAFKAVEVWKDFEALGLITMPDELKEAASKTGQSFQPKGPSKKVNGCAVYPHFG